MEPPLETPTTPLPRVPRRTPRACKQCRASKIKCSGSPPCDRCTRRRDSCIFPSDEPHVSVPERYLRDLQRRLSQAQAQAQAQTEPPADRRPASGGEPSATIADANVAQALERERPPPPPPLSPPSQEPRPHSQPLQSQSQADLGPEAQLEPQPQPQPQPLSSQHPQPHNPLVSRNLPYIQEIGGRLRYLGPTSTWSFCRRALSLLEKHTPSSNGSSAPLNTDGTAFRLRWEPKTSIGLEDVKDLPPRDYTLHLINTAKFHLGELFGVVAEADFHAQLLHFEQTPLQIAQTQRLWFVTYLLLLAFGKAFLASGHGPAALPGSQYAARAMALLPDPAYMHDNPMPSIQVLALVALYFQSIDMRVSAYQYIGQALRLAYVEGIHQHIPDDVVSPQFASRCNNLWWVVYVLDQEITANMGGPSTIPEGVVTVALPSDVSPTLSARVLTLRVRLSRLTASMCSTVYRQSDGLEDSFIRSTTSFLHQLAEVSRELDTAMSSCDQPSHSNLPHVFRHITLSYHHCIVLATRPLVMWLLILSVNCTQVQPQQLASPVAALLQTSVESAMAIVKMLHTLAEQDMLECFIPFQLDYAFAAAMLLSIMEAILPSYVPNGSWSRSVSFVFGEMMTKKNAVARLRQSEVEQLNTLLAPFRQNGSWSTPDAPPARDPDQGDSAVGFGDDLVLSPLRNGDLVGNDLNLPWHAASGLGNPICGNSVQMLELAEQLQIGELDFSMLFEPQM